MSFPSLSIPKSSSLAADEARPAMDAGEAAPPGRPMWRDFLALTKPRITLNVVLTALGGFWLARRFDGVKPSHATLLWMLLGATLVVAGANALNMYLERDTDRLMSRTRGRPLPSGRMRPNVALVSGAIMGLGALPVLTFGVNALTGLLGSVALLSYVLVYTPLKRRTTVSLLVGAVPGALPPLFGWTAAAGRIEWPGVALFAVMFFWQCAHSLAIYLFRTKEYDRAGLKILPVKRGVRATQAHMLGYLIGLVGVSIMLAPLSGPIYLATAILLGALFLAFGVWGFWTTMPVPRWGKNFFLGSLVYLILILAAIMVGL